MKDYLSTVASRSNEQVMQLKVNRRMPGFCFVAVCLMLSNGSVAQQNAYTHIGGGPFEMRKYSAEVDDSFTIFVQLPLNYETETKQHYPVVYLLDGNLYFDMIAAITRKYAEVGMLPPIILVGVGYRDFAEMDSLRSRDYTFPKALPRYEMSVSGGAGRFISFLQTELLPEVDTHFRTDTTQRILAGHSLSGYFTVYALNKYLSSSYNPFRYFIAASPALHYNGYWLLNQLKRSSVHRTISKTGIYVTYGSLEDAEDADEPGQMTVAQTTGRLGALMRPAGVRCKTLVFSNLGHMDTAIPTFIKGLQEAIGKN